MLCSDTHNYGIHPLQIAHMEHMVWSVAKHVTANLGASVTGKQELVSPSNSSPKSPAS